MSSEQAVVLRFIGRCRNFAKRNTAPIVLALLALAVYLPGANWGVPTATGPDFLHAWGNDDLVPLAPLAEMHNTFVEAKPDRNIAYPWFHYFLVACAYAPYLIYQWVVGGLTNPSGVYPFGLSDPVSMFRHLTWIGRSVTVILAVAAVIGAYSIGKSLWGRSAGWLSALFTMLMFPMAYYSRIGNVDVPVLAWTSMGLAVVVRSAREGLTVKRGVWMGLFVALALATKDQAFASFLLVLPLLLWLHLRGARGNGLEDRKRTWRAPMAAVLSFTLTYILASGIAVDPARFGQHVKKLIFASTQSYYLRYPATLSGLWAQMIDSLGYLVEVMGWPSLALAVIGLFLAVRKDRVSLILALSSLGCLLMLLPVRFTRIHYLLPVALPLNAFAAYTISRGLKIKRLVPVTVVAAIGVVGYLLLRTVDLTHDMINDSRYEASAWLGNHGKPGESLLYFGPGDTVPRLDPGINAIKVSHRDLARSTITEWRPDLILVMPIDFNEDRKRVEWREGPHSVYSDYVPSEVFRDLCDGTLGYRLVAQFQTARLLPWLNRPFLSYATVNPPIHIFLREDLAQQMVRLEPWETAPHYPKPGLVRELTVDPLPQKGGL